MATFGTKYVTIYKGNKKNKQQSMIVNVFQNMFHSFLLKIITGGFEKSQFFCRNLDFSQLTKSNINENLLSEVCAA